MRRFIFAVLLAIVTVVSSSVPAYAATETITVNGEGTHTSGSYVGGTGDWQNITTNESPPTTYLSNTTPISSTTIYHDYAFSDMVATPTLVNSVTITGVLQRVQAATLTFYYWDGGTYYNSPSLSATGGWDTLTYTWNTNPATGVAWTKANIDAAQFGVKAATGSSPFAMGYYLSYMKVDIDYTAVSAPSVTTSSASSIAATSATMNGEVTDDGGGTIDYYGFVWDTSDKGDGGNVDPSTPPGTWSNGWKSAVGDYGENTFDHSTGATLIKGTTYYYRAAAHNATGWEYGSAVSFTTIGDPTISTLAATDVASTTARINSNVTFDGNVLTGEPCTIRFVYIAGTGYADYAAIVAGAETTVDVAGTWITGQSPYADITALAVSTTYSYAVRIVNSTATYAYGSVMTFTTESGVYTPTNFTAVPTASTVSLLWVKGVGAQYTLVKYSDATYPPTTADGISAYLGTGNSETLTGLTPGTTYYFSAWGLTAGVYSGTAITALATTLAYDTATSTGTIEAPPSNSWWNQTPSTTNVGSIPMVSGLVQANATAYAIPESSLWYFLWSLFSVGMGVFVYGRGGNKLPLGLGATALMFSLGAVLGLVMLWIMVIFALIGAGFALWGDRR